MDFETIVEELEAEFKTQVDRLDGTTKAKMANLTQRMAEAGTAFLLTKEQRFADRLKDLYSIGASTLAMEAVLFEKATKAALQRAAFKSITALIAAL